MHRYLTTPCVVLYLVVEEPTAAEATSSQARKRKNDSQLVFPVPLHERGIELTFAETGLDTTFMMAQMNAFIQLDGNRIPTFQLRWDLEQWLAFPFELKEKYRYFSYQFFFYFTYFEFNNSVHCKIYSREGPSPVPQCWPSPKMKQKCPLGEIPCLPNFIKTGKLFENSSQTE
jgi:hypothetical protein